MGSVCNFFYGKSVMSMFCNVMMLLLLYVHICVTRTGWKTRPHHKTVILSIKQPINQSINQTPSFCLSFFIHLFLCVFVFCLRVEGGGSCLGLECSFLFVSCLFVCFVVVVVVVVVVYLVWFGLLCFSFGLRFFTLYFHLFVLFLKG